MKDFAISGPEWFDGAAAPVVLVQDERIIYRNAAAANLGLIEGGAVPEDFGDIPCGAYACIEWQGSSWLCRGSMLESGMLIQLERQGKAELSADRLRQLAAKMRVPLGNLIGAIQLLQRPNAVRTEEKRHQYQAIQRKNYRILLRMLDDLELLGSLDEELPFRPTVLDFGGLCGDVVRGVEDLVRQAGRTLSLDVSDGNMLVQGEAQLLRRMLCHLLSNALRSCGEAGSVKLRLEKKGSWVRLTVSDSGTGFSPEELGSAFDPGAGEELLTQGGLGLGIPLCRQVIQRHGGRIALLGGGGGKVMVELPLAKSTEGGFLHSGTDFSGGMNDLMTRLADVLPWQCFAEEE